VRRAANFNIVLDDVSITHVAFSPEFTHAVEAKQIGNKNKNKNYFRFSVNSIINRKNEYLSPILFLFYLIISL